MQIACPNCSTNYQLTPTAIGPGGRTVRCVRCQNVWFVPAPGVMPAVAAGEAAMPDALPPEPDAGWPPHDNFQTPPPDVTAEDQAADSERRPTTAPRRRRLRIPAATTQANGLRRSPTFPSR